MTEKQHIASIVKSFKTRCPNNICDVFDFCDVPLTLIGWVSFRQVYQFGDLPLIVKFPTGPHGIDIEENISHSVNEMDAINRVKRYKKYTHIRKYLPKIYYYSDKTGIIVMHKYKQTDITENNKVCREAEKEILDTMAKEFTIAGNCDIDLAKNFSINEDGSLTLIDWGILGKKSNWHQS